MIMAASLGKCGTPNCNRYAVCNHHIFTRGAFGKKALVHENEIPTCADCHTLTGDSWHASGRDTFSKRHDLEETVRRASLAVRGY